MKYEPLRRRIERYSIPEPMSGCVLWLGQSSRSGDYGSVWNGKRNMLAHRCVWELVNGPIPQGLSVLHRCDVRCCVNPSHLFLGTNADNMADMKAKGRGRGLRGEAHNRAKLTEKDVLAIREATKNGAGLKELAARFGVDRTQIWHIRRGIHWSFVKSPEEQC